MKGRRKTLISASAGLVALAIGGLATLAHDLGGAEAAPGAGHMTSRGVMDDMASGMTDVMRGLMDRDSADHPKPTGPEIPRMLHAPAEGVHPGGTPRMPQMPGTPGLGRMPDMGSPGLEMQMAPGWLD
jgi:hypothetical protein